jgi:hypothetical protein
MPAKRSCKYVDKAADSTAASITVGDRVRRATRARLAAGSTRRSATLYDLGELTAAALALHEVGRPVAAGVDKQSPDDADESVTIDLPLLFCRQAEL